jgi:hypothetical protein
MNKELESWLKTNSACAEGIDRMLSMNITNMQDAYNRADPIDLIWAVTREKVLTKKQCVQFILFCASRVDNLLSDELSQNLILGLGGWLEGAITLEETRKIAYNTLFYARKAITSSFANAILHTFGCDASTAIYSFVIIYSYDFSGGIDKATARKQQAEWIRENIPFESLNLK